MARHATTKKAVSDDADANGTDVAVEPGDSSDLDEGKIFDYITGAPLKDSDKEKVRQRIARAIIHEYGIAAEDMEPDFKVKVGGKNRKLDIAVFKPGTEHVPDNMYRAVIVEKEPKVGTKGAYRMRDPDEARKEFDVLQPIRPQAVLAALDLGHRRFENIELLPCLVGIAHAIGALGADLRLLLDDDRAIHVVGHVFGTRLEHGNV